jgi:excisionase family DNA binding protein
MTATLTAEIPATDTSDMLHGVAEIARFLNVSENTAEYWIREKMIPIRRIGKKIVARRSRLLEAMDPE